MNYSIVSYNHFGKTEVAIVDEEYLPTCAFLNNHLWSTYGTKSLNTKEGYAHTLLFNYRYFMSKSIDLVSRVETGTFLSYEEYDDFKNHCRYRVDSKNESPNVVNFAKISDKKLDYMIHATRNVQNHVSAQTEKGRLKRLEKYIRYLYQVWHFSNFPPVKVSNAFHELNNTLKDDIKSITDDNSVVVDPFESVIPDDVFFRMLEMVRPSSDNNPFKGSRLRNHLIVTIFIETGMREGALAKLKLSDIKDNWDSPRLMVTRTPNDPDDKRKKKAAQKTKAHTSAITEGTMKLLKHYISTDRVAAMNDTIHDFVFVSEKGVTKGQSLAIKSFSNVIQVLASKLDYHLHPHLLRYKWNEIFDIKATELGLDPLQIEDIRKYAMGWSEDSKQSRRYNEFRLAVKNQKLSVARQNDFISNEMSKYDEC